MKTTLSVVAFLLSSTFASANSIPDFLKQFPAHVQDGYRDTGCDPDQQVQVEGTNYFNNPTCPKVKGASDSVKADVKAPKPDDSDDGNGDDTSDDGDDNGGPTSDDHGPSDDTNNDDTSDYNGDDSSDDSNGDNSDDSKGYK